MNNIQSDLSPMRRSVGSYIRFIIIMLPVIIPTMAVFEGLYSWSPKAIPYLAGLAITMTFGKGIGHLIWNYIPKLKSRSPENIHATCVMFGDRTNLWGYHFSRPARHAIFLSYTLAYMSSCHLMYDNSSRCAVPIMLAILTIGSAFVRSQPPMNCVTIYDIMGGWIIGICFGVGIAISMAQSPDSQTWLYFTDEKGGKKCKIKQSRFRCNKGKRLSGDLIRTDRSGGEGGRDSDRRSPTE